MTGKLKKKRLNPKSSMKRLALIYSFLLALFITFPAVLLAGQFKITRVYDGDTVKAQGHDIEIKVRLVSIDTPETSKEKRDPGQPYSQQAKKYLTDLILNRSVDIKGYGLDRYNRILGVIYLGNQNINLEMVKAGFAEVYRGMAPHKFELSPYWQAEKKARDSKKGMWSLGAKYVSPKDWRRMQRSK
ncbi:MAG: thermonuclease family protein [Desulfobacteraceae bacterium]|nr:MAG: thermonuclease family protein [Desulfobacteraceae bacterium]